MILDNTDPLLIKEPIFKKQVQNALSTRYNDFVSEYFYQWLLFVCLGEHNATVAYPIIKQRFENAYYANHTTVLKDHELKSISDYINNMIIDENNHIEFLHDILQSIYSSRPTDIEYQQNTLNVTNWLDFESLEETLARYYIGECYLWVGFYKIYKNTADSNLKRVFHRLLVDESRHNNAIYKIFLKIKNTAELDLAVYNKTVRSLRYFGLPYITEKFKLSDSNSKKDHWWLNMLFDHEWHQNFNEIFIKKCYKVAAIFDSTLDINNYQKLINQNY